MAEELVDALAMPKSSTRETPSRPTMTLCGEMSRVDDVERLAVLVLGLVGGEQAHEQVDRDGEGDGHRHDAVARPTDAREPGHRLALDVSSMTRKRLAVESRDHVEHGDDVRVADAGGDARLLEEHRDEVGIVRELRVEALDGDGAGKTSLGGQAADVDRRHPPRGELVVEDIPTYDASAGLDPASDIPVGLARGILWSQRKIAWRHRGRGGFAG